MPRDSAEDNLNTTGHQMCITFTSKMDQRKSPALLFLWSIIGARNGRSKRRMQIFSLKRSKETFGAPVEFHQHVLPLYRLHTRTFNRWRTSGSWIIEPYVPPVKRTPTPNVTSSHAAGWGTAIRMNPSVRLRTWVHEQGHRPNNANEQSISINLMVFK